MAVAYAVGRFQPPTIGHAKLIRETIKLGKAFVFVSSAKPGGKEAEKNPLSSSEKIKYLKLMFPNGVEFVDMANCDPSCSGRRTRRRQYTHKTRRNKASNIA